MYRTVVYDDGYKGMVIEEFTSDNEVEVVNKATQSVRELRRGRDKAVGRYTFRLIKEA